MMNRLRLRQVLDDGILLDGVSHSAARYGLVDIDFLESLLSGAISGPANRPLSPQQEVLINVQFLEASKEAAAIADELLREAAERYVTLLREWAVGPMLGEKP